MFSVPNYLAGKALWSSATQGTRPLWENATASQGRHSVAALATLLPETNTKVLAKVWHLFFVHQVNLDQFCASDSHCEQYYVLLRAQSAPFRQACLLPRGRLFWFPRAAIERAFISELENTEVYTPCRKHMQHVMGRWRLNMTKR